MPAAITKSLPWLPRNRSHWTVEDAQDLTCSGSPLFHCHRERLPAGHSVPQQGLQRSGACTGWRPLLHGFTTARHMRLDTVDTCGGRAANHAHAADEEWDARALCGPRDTPGMPSGSSR